MVLLLALGAYFLFPRKAAESAGIVAFGDSLTYGTGSTKSGGFVTLLSEKSGMPIVNMGVPGDTTRDALLRLDSVLAGKPDVVIVLFGGNDLLKGIPATETAKNLALIDTKLTSSGAKVLLLKLSILNGIYGNPDLMSPDALHPNDKGYALMAERIYPDLKRLLR